MFDLSRRIEKLIGTEQVVKNIEQVRNKNKNNNRMM
jgi:hypothetical protein